MLLKVWKYITINNNKCTQHAVHICIFICKFFVHIYHQAESTATYHRSYNAWYCMIFSNALLWIQYILYMSIYRKAIWFENNSCSFVILWCFYWSILLRLPERVLTNCQFSSASEGGHYDLSPLYSLGYRHSWVFLKLKVEKNA